MYFITVVFHVGFVGLNFSPTGTGKSGFAEGFV